MTLSELSKHSQLVEPTEGWQHWGKGHPQQGLLHGVLAGLAQGTFQCCLGHRIPA